MSSSLHYSQINSKNRLVTRIGIWSPNSNVMKQITILIMNSFLDVNIFPAENELHTVMVTGAPYSSLSHARTEMKSKIAIPKDICKGENVIFLERFQSEFHLGFAEVLNAVRDEKQVLIIVMNNTNTLTDLIKESEQEYLDHRSWSQCWEKEVDSWIAGASDVKFVITDEWTAAGFEFDTVILIGYSHEMSLSQGSLSQR